MELAPDKVGTATLFEPLYHLFPDEENISGSLRDANFPPTQQSHRCAAKTNREGSEIFFVLPERDDS